MKRIKSYVYSSELDSFNSLPYCDKDNSSGIIAVAEGTGSSDSADLMHHKKDTKRITGEIIRDIFPEYSHYNETPGDNFSEWLKLRSECMSDSENSWGQLMPAAVLSHLLCYLYDNKDTVLSSANERQKMVDFIYSGAGKLHMNLGPESNRLYRRFLPSSAALVKYSFTDKGKIKAEVIWNGNARAYAYIPKEGLKQLTEDDKDSSGAVTNLFSIQDGTAAYTKLNYRSFFLPEKSVIFVCNSGLYDYYVPADNLGIGTEFLQVSVASCSFKSLVEKWAFHYNKLMIGDAVLSLAAFGYDYFDYLTDIIPEYKKAVDLYSAYLDSKRNESSDEEDKYPEKYRKEKMENCMDEVNKFILRSKDIGRILIP